MICLISNVNHSPDLSFEIKRGMDEKISEDGTEWH